MPVLSKNQIIRMTAFWLFDTSEIQKDTRQIWDNPAALKEAGGAYAIEQIMGSWLGV